MPTDRRLRLGHSPDPDDAFMFYALAQDPPLIDAGGYRFEHVLQDIQTLNQRAMKGELEITAISIHAYPYVADKYALTSCGSSMGDKYGPMVIAHRQQRDPRELDGARVAIPGKLTTAFLALNLHARDLGITFQHEVLPFDQIPAAVKSGRFDYGLIIHEGQLTYRAMGLHLVVDLGQWWHDKTGLPLPLGGNCIRKDLGAAAMQEITNVLKRSIRYSLAHREPAVKYALQFGRDLDQSLADRFVGMYVNDWTLDYGPRGREAITRLLAEGASAGLVPAMEKVEYVTAT
jgi:1,4-dihydroxy-6-naphthoate synthase